MLEERAKNLAALFDKERASAEVFSATAPDTFSLEVWAAYWEASFGSPIKSSSLLSMVELGELSAAIDRSEAGTTTKEAKLRTEVNERF